MLNSIVNQTRQAVALAKQNKPLTVIKQDIVTGIYAFSTAIKQRDWALVAECKLASPAKGTLCAGYSVSELAGVFAAHGAAALSVHTNAAFRGSIDDIARIKQTIDLPVLCKEFILDEYQLYAARAAGADAVLLIAAILTADELGRFIGIAADLGMDALVEVHTLPELQQVQQTTAKLIGINNRNLETFATSIEQTFALLPYYEPGGRLLISESGITTSQDALRLKQAGVNGRLVGEGLVTAGDIAAKTRELALLSAKEEGRDNNA